MRLINTTTLEFDEFIGTKIPNYAIPSHTWGDEEVTFQDKWAAFAAVFSVVPTSCSGRFSCHLKLSCVSKNKPYTVEKSAYR